MKTGMLFESFVPTRILFGSGQLSNLHQCKMPGSKALIVISAGKSTRTHGYLDQLLRELALAGSEYAVYDGVASNPIIKNIMDGAALARSESCDFIVGLGGGSAIDASKAIAMMAVNRGELPS